MAPAMRCCALLTILGFFGAGCATAPPTTGERQALVDQSAAALKQMRATDRGLDRFISNAWGYAIFPNAAKGGLIFGGAYGRGVVFEKGTLLGYSDLTQGTFGFQVGGQSFTELIVFETRTDLNRFTAGKFALAANVSAVILQTGAADTARYTDGVAVFVQPIGGLMVEAVVGGQQFTFAPK